MARIGPIFRPLRACVSGFKNAVSLAAIRVEKESRLAIWRVGHTLVKIFQKSWASPRNFLGVPVKTLYAAKDGSDWAIFSLSPEERKRRQQYGIHIRD